MGIYDREYYRREGPSYLGQFSTGEVCRWLVIINAIVFLVQLATLRMDQGSAGPVTEALIMSPEAVLQGQVWRLLTYAFLHDPLSIWHIVFNMLFLWWFGRDIEHVYGSREFLAFYLTAALLGGLAFLAFGDGHCLGASGAVTAVLLLCAIHFPHRTILLFFLIPVPIWALVAFQIIQDVYLFVGQFETTTAVSVHLAGAAFAAVYYKLHWRLTSIWDVLSAWRARRGRPRLRVYRGEDHEREPVPVAAPPSTPGIDEHLEAKLDAILEKVARSGKESLTESEKAILLRASEIYKRRRS